ncbi:hypothetical protein C2S52_012241 [Perilla frutescens var. hirtella]|uniref:EF-hand domain-containing protein n=1 Tax=Perilla frutescens var. hirtella TaxID=608512 RepID=A0AAD4P2W6_PERFH|nr:hypothetical protein C2S52_012241 [Perilla frutescens var. hirtella]KAH6785185.1 hypothetical protein C2S51_037640 [Perilla frutescens var. frutescens]KAH6824186.1 hypothetical protein C2S53_011697 [Perilla frutescens var. hirtella]
MAYYNEYSSIKNMKNHSDGFKYLKKITQILLPLSVFSLLFSHSSLTPLFLESYDYLVSNFSFKVKIFTYTTERNCIFLLCNGILVLIIQSSGLISKITPVNSAPKTSRIDDHRGEKVRFEETKDKGVEKVEILEEKSSENGGGFAAEFVEEDFESCEVEKLDAEEEEYDDIDDDGEIDKEELNKKFEDFIKKVKLEIQSA